MSFSHIAHINEIDTAVFEGCGIRFPSIVGALIALVKAGVWNNIKNIAASSGGAFPALFAALGMDPDEMVDTMNQMDESSITNRTMRSKIPFFGTPFSILTLHGLHNSDILIRFAKNLLIKKGFSANLTFRQHAELRKTNPSLKNIFLTAVNNSTSAGVLTVFPSEKFNTQDVKIAEAFAAALAYPVQFTPVKILINGKLIEFTDGGVRDNYPYSIFPKKRWHKIVGVKPDTVEETFNRFHYRRPGLLNFFFWNLVTDNHFIYESFPNSVKIFVDPVDTFKSITLIDRQALLMSGEMAMTARLVPSVETAVEHKVENNASVNARTMRYLKLMENDTGLSGYIFPTYYFNLLMIYNEIKNWKEYHELYEVDLPEHYIHYNALLDQLSKSYMQSLCDVFIAGYALSKIRHDLFLLLRELADKAAVSPEATPQLITDVIIAYLQTNELNSAIEFLARLEKNEGANLKLIKIDHQRILQLLNQDKNPSEEKKQFIHKIKHHYERLIKTYPGAYETYLTVKFGDLFQAKQYSKAAKIAEKMRDEIPKDYLKKIYEAAMKQFENAPEQIQKLQEMFPLEVSTLALRQSSLQLS